MKPSPTCYALIKRFESCRLEAYPDEATNPPVWTIGWGHTGPEVHEGLVWTQEQADAALEADADEHCAQMAACVKVPLNQNQVDSLTDFVYEDGAGRLHGSMLLKVLNMGQYDRVPFELYHQDPDGTQHGWIFSGGKVRSQIVERRKAEIELWNSPVQA